MHMIPLVHALEKVFPSLGKKIALAVAGVSLIAGSAFVYFAQRTGYAMLEQQAQTKAHGVTNLLGAMLERVMMEGKSDQLQQALSSATAYPDIIDASILRTDGTIAVTAKTGSSYGRFPLEDLREIPGTGGERYMSVRERDSTFEYVVTPIVKKPQCNQCHKEAETLRGYFAMKIAIDDVRALALQHRTVNILMTCLTFGGLGIIIFLAISILVIKPIGRLHSHVRQIEGGVEKLESGERTRFPLLPEPESNDEIGDLCRDFNNLVNGLNASNAKLFELHQAQLEQADRLATTGEMAASIAHEIKNPIAGVLGALQVFDSETSQDNPRKEIIAEMVVQLQRINHAVDDLLSYARPVPPHFDKIDLNAIIQKTVSLLSSQVNGKKIAIEQQLLPEPLMIFADKKQLQQIVWNLILNGIQAIESTGTVIIKTSRVNSSVRVVISDTGRGILPEHIERIFKPFFTTKHKGTGLGMTITKRIIEQHNGTIEIESQPGRGTSVTVTLPNDHKG